jgi:hypothetical protein
VVRLLMSESVVLALAAGVLASVMARWSGALLFAFIPPMPIPIAIDAGLNLRVLVFSTVVSLGAGLLLGVFPGLQASRVDLVTPLKEGAGGSVASWRRGRVRQSLIVVQVALALVLLVSAGLFVRALDAARNIDPGFQARAGIVGAIDVGAAGYDEARGKASFRRLTDELRALPGVEAASVGQRLPLTVTESSDRSVDVEGYTPAAGEGGAAPPRGPLPLPLPSGAARRGARLRASRRPFQHLRRDDEVHRADRARRSGRGA